MADDAQLLYLEPDDEITGVVRRLRRTDADRIVLVAPGRSRATSSAVALRLLAQVASGERRHLAIVGDALTRSLASEAGLTVHASVADARAGMPATDAPLPRAPIRVVQAEEPTAPVGVVPRDVPATGDETRPIGIQRREPRPVAEPRRQRRRVLPLVLLGALALAVAGAGVAAAIVLPAATIAITPEAEAIGPIAYDIRIADPGVESGTVTATVTGTATGTYRDLAAASGAVVFRNYNTVAMEVPPGTRVAAGEIAFATTSGIVVPSGSLTAEGTIAPGEEIAPIVAEVAGPAANVAEGTITTVLDPGRDALLRGFAQNTRQVVFNLDATAGGIDVSGPLIQQADVDAAVAALEADLDARLADALATEPGRLYPPAAPAEEPVIEGLEGLVDTRDVPTFELTGSIDYSRRYVERDAVEAAARERLAGDADAVPPESQLLADTTRVTLGQVEQRGEALIVEASVTAAAAPDIDSEAIRRDIAGMSPEQARAVLDDVGDVEIDLWPGWVRELPRLLWRIEIREAAVDEAGGG
jgi:hypothetical protein